MNEMVVRVARAIASVADDDVFVRKNDRWEVCRHTDPEVVRPAVVKTFSTHGEALEFAAYLTLDLRARAAIAAMREPTEAMCDAFDHMRDMGGDLKDAYGYRDVYRAMIDAALAD